MTTAPLDWDSTYAIALALKAAHPAVDFQALSLGTICQWTLALDNFIDDPALVNDGLLSAIYQDWFEETLHDRQ